MAAVFFARGVAITGWTFEVINKSDGTPVTSGVTCKITKDGVGYATSTNAPTHVGGGLWALDLTASERDAKITTVQYNSATGVTGSEKIISDATLGPGATECNFSFGSASEDADVWVTTQADPTTVIASGQLDSNGDITVYLNAGSYTIYYQKNGYNLTPQNFTVVT